MEPRKAPRIPRNEIPLTQRDWGWIAIVVSACAFVWLAAWRFL